MAGKRWFLVLIASSNARLFTRLAGVNFWQFSVLNRRRNGGTVIRRNSANTESRISPYSRAKRLRGFCGSSDLFRGWAFPDFVKMAAFCYFVRFFNSL